MSSDDVLVAHFEAVPRSAPESRRFLADVLAGWHCEALAPDATACLVELATNAILHTRLPFEVVLRRLGRGVRIDVIDGRPQELPIAVPANGSAADLTAVGTTGRGLMIIAALATRWGVSTSDRGKSVWAELDPDGPDAGTEPILAVTASAPADDDRVSLRFVSLPVRAAVASGVHVEELVRELQLGPRAGLPTGGQLAELYDVLDRSAPVRLAGRHAALRAAAANRDRFDLDISVPREAVTAIGTLNRLLAAFSDGSRTSAQLPADVAAFRSWLEQEVGRQLAGEPPEPYPVA